MISYIFNSSSFLDMTNQRIFPKKFKIKLVNTPTFQSCHQLSNIFKKLGYCRSKYCKKIRDNIIIHWHFCAVVLDLCILISIQFTQQYVIFIFSETVSMSKIQIFYYEAKKFQHFDYIYKRTREYTLRNFGEKRYSCSSIETNPMPKDAILKIGIFGVFTEGNLKLIFKTKSALLHNSSS